MSYLNDPEFWRKRAEETRAMAEHVTDLAVKRTMLTIADEITASLDQAESEATHETLNQSEM
jgi:replicative DNA helicase